MDDEPQDELVVTSTSLNSARVDPIVLKGEEGDRRLVFIPELVTNSHDASASVRGTLCYQRKRPSGQWEDCEFIRLTSLRSGEGVRLSLDAATTALLYAHLGELYALYTEHGIVPGQRKYRRVDDRSPLARFREAVSDEQAVETVDAALRWLASEGHLSRLASVQDAETRDRLDAELGLARLRSFVAEGRALLDAPRESAWQDLLGRESWAISQLFAVPLVIVRGQAYLGGKSFDNRGGTVADFLFRASHTGNCLLVEIKTSMAALMRRDGLTRNNSINVAPTLSAGVQQLLGDREQLMHDYYSLTRGKPSPVNAIDPQMLLVVGRVERLDEDERASFEHYRNSLRNVQVIGFDELVTKAEQLIELLSDPVEDPTAPVSADAGSRGPGEGGGVHPPP